MAFRHKLSYQLFTAPPQDIHHGKDNHQGKRPHPKKERINRAATKNVNEQGNMLCCSCFRTERERRIKWKRDQRRTMTCEGAMNDDH
jgi:hypothetical protein